MLEVKVIILYECRKNVLTFSFSDFVIVIFAGHMYTSSFDGMATYMVLLLHKNVKYFRMITTETRIDIVRILKSHNVPVYSYFLNIIIKVSFTIGFFFIIIFTQKHLCC